MFFWGVIWLTAALLTAIASSQAVAAVVLFQIATYVFALLALYYMMLGLIERPKMLRVRIMRFDELVRRG